MNVGIYVYDEAEVLDFSGPFEVFSTASRICSSQKPFHVFLVGESGDLVEARAGYRVMPSFGFHNHPHIDVLLVPGGVHTHEMAKPQVIEWSLFLQHQHEQYVIRLIVSRRLFYALEMEMRDD